VFGAGISLLAGYQTRSWIDQMRSLARRAQSRLVKLICWSVALGEALNDEACVWTLEDEGNHLTLSRRMAARRIDLSQRQTKDRA
jgi:hypothetical protein